MNVRMTFAAVALFAGFSAPAFADTDHTTIMGCYASVHSQCYGNGANSCSDEVYQGGLDECDSAYGNTSEIDTGRTDSFASPMNRPALGILVAPSSSARR